VGHLLCTIHADDSKRGTIQLEPALHRGSLPLTRGVIDQLRRHRIAIQDQTLEHQREIGICNAPLPEEVRVVVREQGLGGRAEFLGRCLGCRAQRLASSSVDEARRVMSSNDAIQ
jgi:hypothetical protein